MVFHDFYFLAGFSLSVANNQIGSDGAAPAGIRITCSSLCRGRYVQEASSKAVGCFAVHPTYTRLLPSMGSVVSRGRLLGSRLA